jgi:Leucine-rich repeat (LRR) protein
LFEILTGLHPMEKPLREMVEDALDEGGLGTVLDHKCEWDPAMAAKLAAVALRCSEQRKVKRATVQEVLPELERLRNPNYMPTLAVGNTYYHPDTGLLTTEGDSDEGNGGGGESGDSGERVLEEGGAMRAPLMAPLLMKHDDEGYEGHSAPKLSRCWFAILVAFAVGIAGLVFGVHRSRHPPPGPMPPRVVPCVSSSSSLVKSDCTAWQQLFDDTGGAHWANCATNRNTPCGCAYNDTQFHQTRGVQCSAGRITKINLFTPHGHNMVGTIPTEIGVLTELMDLTFHGNRGLIGTIPTEIGNLLKLQKLKLDTLMLDGSVPSSIAKLSDLKRIYLPQNNLSGKLPVLPFGQYANCSFEYNGLGLGHNHFLCPLPPNSSHCHAHQLLCHEACVGNSSDLDDIDCAIWQKIVLPSKYFTTSTPRACSSAAYKTDPCSCTDVIGCDGGRIVSVHLSDRQLSFDASKDDSLSHLSALQTLNFGPGVHPQNLVGPLPQWLLKLTTSLTVLHLGNNHFSGGIGLVAKLTNLKYLRLAGNKFNGSIEALAPLSKLVTLRIDANDFSGPIDAMKQLTNLDWAELGGNQLTGTINALRNLKKLGLLNLRNNQLTGPINVLETLTSLTYLNLDSNQLTGTIPSELGQLVGLRTLTIHINQLAGTIPSQLAKLTALETLNFGSNMLNGTIPSQLGELTGLSSLGFYASHHLTGKIPSQLAKLTKLTDLELYSNELTGAVPSLPFKQYTQCCVRWSGCTNSFSCPLPAGAMDCKCNGKPSVLCDHLACNGSSAGLKDADCRAWQKIVLSSKYFTTSTPRACNESHHVTDPCSCTGVIGCDGGRIVKVDLHGRGLPALDASADDSLSHFGALQILNFGPGTNAKSDNNLVGPLPQWLLKLTNLEILNLRHNQFSGPISMITLKKLTSLDIGNNLLSGGIGFVAKLTNLKFLRLAGNKFNGSISAVSSLLKIGLLSLDSNELSGPIDALSKLSSLYSLYLEANQLTGPINVLETLTSLTYLNVNNNQLTGSIPSTLGRLTRLFHLHLSSNQLAGSVPQELVGLKKLRTLTLDTNHLTGKLPAFDFAQFTGCCYMYGDLFTCPLPAGANVSCVGGPACGGLLKAPTCTRPCTGSSSTLIAGDCSAWQTFTRNPVYTEWAEAKCGAKVHTDPCSCTFDMGEVKCADGRITVLGLGSQALPPSGGVPVALLDLTGLQVLNLTLNQLNGAIPTAIGQLTSLTVLDLGNSRLGGTIPSQLAELTGLTYLALGNSYLSGTIPSQLAELTGLTYLYFPSNRLGGTIPSQLAKLTGLTHLYLNQNRLNGTIPSQLVELTGLTTLYIFGNRLTGVVPSLPFKQYTTACCVWNPSQKTNHFTCPLPTGAADCKCVSKPGLACNTPGHSAFR